MSFWTLKASNLATGTALVFLTCQLFSEGFIWIVIAKWLVKIIWKLLNRRKSSKLLFKKSLKNSGPIYLKSWLQIRKRWLQILNSWLQIPLNLALSTCNVGPNCRKGHVAEQQKGPLRGQKCKNIFFKIGFLFTIPSTICHQKTPQLWTSPLKYFYNFTFYIPLPGHWHTTTLSRFQRSNKYINQ